MGKIGAQRITNYKKSNVIISLHYIGQLKQGAKHTKTPTFKGHAPRIVQHDYGHPDSSTHPLDHASTRISHFNSATLPTYTTCTCPCLILISVLCAFMQESYSSCQVWTMDALFVNNSITDAFHAFKTNSFCL